MKKRIYITPSVKVMEVLSQQILSGSNENNDTLSVNPTPSDDGGNVAHSRENSNVWIDGE